MTVLYALCNSVQDLEMCIELYMLYAKYVFTARLWLLK